MILINSKKYPGAGREVARIRIERADRVARLGSDIPIDMTNHVGEFVAAVRPLRRDGSPAHGWTFLFPGGETRHYFLSKEETYLERAFNDAASQ